MSGYLLDSNAFLWLKANPAQIGSETLAELADTSNRLYVSVAGLWELAIKSAMGKLNIFERQIGRNDTALRDALRESGIQVLSIGLLHVLAAARLPQRHRDPLDRMMIAQAQQENLVVLTRDSVFDQYNIRVVLI